MTKPQISQACYQRQASIPWTACYSELPTFFAMRNIKPYFYNLSVSVKLYKQKRIEWKLLEGRDFLLTLLCFLFCHIQASRKMSVPAPNRICYHHLLSRGCISCSPVTSHYTSPQFLSWGITGPRGLKDD